MHFLLSCPKYTELRERYIPQFKKQMAEFNLLSTSNKVPILLGEEKRTANLAAQYVSACHNLRDSV
ncbi:UNVERIFIED_CONTAM: hypothetical protein FKN15_058820 [Acipenser sinensis]